MPSIVLERPLFYREQDDGCSAPNPGAFSHWAARIGGLSVCVGPRQSHAKGCYEPAANESAWSRRTDTARKRSWS